MESKRVFFVAHLCQGVFPVSFNRWFCDGTVTRHQSQQGPDVPNSKAHEIWGDGVRFHGCEPEPWYKRIYEQLKQGTWMVV